MNPCPQRHPESGFTYTYVIPSYTSYRDVFEIYSRAAARVPWIETWSHADWDRRWTAALQEEHRFIVFLGPAPSLSTERRRCFVAVFYSEMIGPRDQLVSQQVPETERLIRHAGAYDAVITHTPGALSELRRLLPESALFHAPVGYDPEVMGRPLWDAAKERDLVFYGFHGQRRQEVLLLLRSHLRHRLEEIGGYGVDRHRLLNAARAILSITHGSGVAHAAFRTWQAIASSASLVMEPIDAWPAEAGHHYLEVPRVTPENASEVAGLLDEALDDAPRLLRTARLAHEELSLFSAEHCLDRYMVPISLAVKSRKPASAAQSS